MTLLRSSVLGLLVATCLILLAACGGDVAEKLIGSWKTESVNPDTGKASVLVITKDSATINGTAYQVEFKTISLTVDVFDKGAQKSLFLATKINPNDMEVRGDMFGDKGKLVRITEEEAAAMLKEMQP